MSCWHLAARPEQAGTWSYLLPGVGGALAWLRSLNPGPNGRLGLCAANHPSVAAILLAAPLAGIRLVLLQHRLTPREQQRLRDEAGLDCVLGIDQTIPKHFADSAFQAEPPEPEWIALELFTSGSSGPPKTAALSLRALCAAADASGQHLGLAPGERWLCPLGLDHIGGAATVYRAARHGNDLCLCQGFDAELITEQIDHTPVTGCSLVPTMLRRLLAERASRAWPQHLRCILTGGAALAQDLRLQCSEHGRAPCHSYGLTEFGGMCGAQPTAGSTADDSGHALPGYTISALGQELQIQAQAAFSGYARQGRLFTHHSTATAFSTGDLGQLSNGRLQVLGRADDLIITGGEKVAPGDIEAAIRLHPAITDCCVVAVDDPEWGQRVCALIVSDHLPSDLAAHLGPLLAGPKRPKSWLVTAAMPQTPRGKVDRRAVRLLFKPS
ncbi:MAG: AMP-binding protein [Planctomycetota bacterium]|nr:AMP-binding protein [Planctomycetota bacterium]